jgi:hypothetical protein
MLPRTQDILFAYLASVQKEYPAPDTIRSRVSSAGKCARSIGLQISGLTATNPPDGYSLVNFHIGDKIHDMVQKAIIAHWPDAQTEVEGAIDDFLTGHCDVLYTAEDGEKVVCEIKSIADFGFELATGAELKSNGRWKKKEKVIEGPKREHKLQAAIYALMFGAKYVAIVYVRKTATKGEVVTWEWRFNLKELYDMASEEISRQRAIVAQVRANELPEREWEGGIIDDPAKTKWPCSYCDHRDSCIQLGPGTVKIV